MALRAKKNGRILGRTSTIISASTGDDMRAITGARYRAFRIRRPICRRHAPIDRSAFRARHGKMHAVPLSATRARFLMFSADFFYLGQLSSTRHGTFLGSFTLTVLAFYSKAATPALRDARPPPLSRRAQDTASARCRVLRPPPGRIASMPFFERWPGRIMPISAMPHEKRFQARTAIY